MKRIFPTISPLAVGGVIATIAVMGSIGLWVGNMKLSDIGSNLEASVANIASLLDARSPGERTKAELSKSKLAGHVATTPALATVEVTERVLGKIFPPTRNDHLVINPEDLLALTPLEVPIDQFASEDLAPLAQTFLGGPLPVRGGGFGPSFISGGSSGGGGSGDQTAAPPPLVPAVPEPSTWVLMLMGAAMCGASMRRQKQLQRQAFV